MALAMGMFIYSCEKGDDNNISSGEKKKITSNIVEELNSIFGNIESDNASFKLNVQLANENNPFDSVGVKHNEVLSYLNSLELTESTICNSLTEASREFDTRITLNCQEILNVINNGTSKTFDDLGNYKADLLDELLSTDKISENEYSIVNTTIENVYNNNDLNQRIQLLKASEEYTKNSQVLTDTEKGRIQRTFAIYRYSTYYWEVETNKLAGPGADLADASAEHWLLNSGYSPAQDGGDVYVLSGLISLMYFVLGY